MDNDTAQQPIISMPDNIARDIQLFMMFILMTSCVIGMVLNVINMTVLTRIKSKETINITLTGLAVSDFMICFTVIAIMITHLPWVQFTVLQKLRWNPIHVFYISIGLPSNIFNRTTILLTTLVTFERCIAVTFPLRVKSVFTRKRMKAAVVFIFMIAFCSIAPDLKVNRLEWTFFPSLNMSILSQSQKDDFYEVYRYVTPLDVLFFYIFSFLIITSCTTILINNLKKAMSWRRRNASAGSTSQEKASMRETRIVKMVIVLAIVFIVCFIPNTVMVMMVSFTRNKYTLQDDGLRVMMTVNWVVYFLAVMNGNTNLFVYYRNNPNYKEVFNKLFCPWQSKN